MEILGGLEQKMNLQIFGSKKCKETKKAEMYFKERRIPFQKIEISEKGMSRGEIQAVLHSLKAEDLVDTTCKLYKEKNLKYIKHDPVEVLLEFPMLLKTPVVRDGRRATIGFQPNVWKTWLSEK